MDFDYLFYNHSNVLTIDETQHTTK
ncbi:protein of unknown function [Pseudodesulfovibrio piezophilus C1TLV30]|uniref:Uncharacterized protein n=1 Tax=Pseudodesulfovibrio piezophilus (strain DSM 21447 / JCM 15486 / C1TLV30) TaxID=1322246 RepID=M1WJ59_PSEP2|nr:protein of unknown function [Pseudodesulfovibrio piezophilus C1TLV30]